MVKELKAKKQEKAKIKSSKRDAKNKAKLKNFINRTKTKSDLGPLDKRKLKKIGVEKQDLHKNMLMDKFVKDFTQVFYNYRDYVWKYMMISLSLFLFDLTFISLFGDGYYLTFVKFFSTAFMASIIMLSLSISNKYVRYSFLSVSVLYLSMWVAATPALLAKFNKIFTLSDISDISLLTLVFKTGFVILIVAFLVFITIMIARAIGRNNFSTSYIHKIVYSFGAIISWVMIVALVRPTYISGVGEWHSYGSFVQNNKSWLGRSALSEFGVYGNMMLGSKSFDIVDTRKKESDYLTSIDYSNKNLNVIMFESLDYLLLETGALPTLDNIYENSMRFNNYAIAQNIYATCQSEARVLVGSTFGESRVCPWTLSLEQEHKETNIFNQFNKMGYQTNYFHSSGHEFYNRDNRISGLGADTNTFYSDGGITKEIRDEQFAKDHYLDTMTGKYMNFFLTYDAHVGADDDIYTDDTLLKEMLAIYNGDEELAKYGYRARSTDNAVKAIVGNAAPDDVFIIMSDHIAYYLNDRVENERGLGIDKWKVPFMVYDGGNTKGDNQTMFSAADVLPMIYDMFNIKGVGLDGRNPLKTDKQSFYTASGQFYHRGNYIAEMSINKELKKNWNWFAREYHKTFLGHE